MAAPIFFYDYQGSDEKEASDNPFFGPLKQVFMRSIYSSVLVLGSSNLDQILKVNRLPAPGETVTDGVYAQAFGGKGANQAVAAARAGAQVHFVSCLGADTYGDAMLENLVQTEIDVRFIRRVKDQASGMAQIWVDEKGQNSIVVALGANHSLSPSDVDAALRSKGAFSVALLQMEMPEETAIYAIKACHQQGIPVFLNLAPYRSLPKALFSQITCLILNETEAAALWGREIQSPEEAETASKQLAEELGVPNVVITLGAAGLVWANVKSAFYLKAPAVRAMDTTAAGDVFCGYLAAGFADRLEWTQNLQLAQHAAALSVTRLGAQSSIPGFREVKNFLAHD